MPHRCSIGFRPGDMLGQSITFTLSLSPDLNPFEHLWGILKRKVEEHKVSNIHQLCDVVMEEWKRTPVATCESLVNSMPKIMQNNGGHTVHVLKSRLGVFELTQYL